MARRVTLIVVTDARYDDARIERVVESIAAVPGLCVQLRDRSARSDEDLSPLATRLRALTARAGALFVVNRRVALARRVYADGVHAPASETDRTGFVWNSAPAHDAKQLHDARIAGAACALVSPIFATPGEGKAPPRGLGAIRSARALEPELLIAALGGVDETNVAACREAGAHAVAVVRAVFEADDPARVAQCLAQAAP
ncbi:MAG TPA: thiamine phosphate synthase [Polyangiaceae bacterium]